MCRYEFLLSTCEMTTYDYIKSIYTNKIYFLITYLIVYKCDEYTL